MNIEMKYLKMKRSRKKVGSFLYGHFYGNLNVTMNLRAYTTIREMIT